VTVPDNVVVVGASAAGLATVEELRRVLASLDATLVSVHASTGNAASRRPPQEPRLRQTRRAPASL
jgi:NADPH-dependent 2,4-dienoyl-CoA reductase/sulfur reductase-like enzyme